MPDENINIVEYAKGLSDPLASGMIEHFARSSDVLEAMPFKSASKGINVFSRETSEPNVQFRALNAEPEISHGTQEPFQDVCKPISGLLEIDRIVEKREGIGKQRTYMKGQMKKGARVWTDTLINGDSATDPREWDGLFNRCRATGTAVADVNGTNDDSRLIANATGSGGGPLSLSMLDIAVSQVASPTHIMMPRRTRTRFKAAARDPNLSNGRITHDMETDLGRRVLRFDGVEILVGYEVSKDSQFLPFNEVAFGGGSAVTSSLYVVSLREDGICGIQTSAPEFLPVDTDRGVFKRNLFEWDNGITWEELYAGIRMSSITDAAIVA